MAEAGGEIYVMRRRDERKGVIVYEEDDYRQVAIIIHMSATTKVFYDPIL